MSLKSLVDAARIEELREVIVVINKFFKSDGISKMVLNICSSL